MVPRCSLYPTPPRTLHTVCVQKANDSEAWIFATISHVDNYKIFRNVIYIFWTFTHSFSDWLHNIVPFRFLKSKQKQYKNQYWFTMIGQWPSYLLNVVKAVKISILIFFRFSITSNRCVGCKSISLVGHLDNREWRKCTRGTVETTGASGPRANGSVREHFSHVGVRRTLG